MLQKMLVAGLTGLFAAILATPFIVLSKRKAKKEHEKEKEKYYKDLATRVVYIIKNAEFMPGQQIVATFGSGKKRIFDASDFVRSHDIIFSKGKVVNGSIIWNDDIVLTAEYFYQHSTPYSE